MNESYVSLPLIKNVIPQNSQNRYEVENNADFMLSLVKSVHKAAESLTFHVSFQNV